MPNDNTVREEAHQSTSSNLSRRALMKLAGVTAAAGAFGTVEIEEANASQASDITKEEALNSIDYSLEHPRVYHRPEDISRARENIQSGKPWAIRFRDRVIELAENPPPFTTLEQSFVELDDQQLIDLKPITAPDGLTYMGWPYGSEDTIHNGNLCPIDGTSLSLVDLDTPGKVECEEGHVFPGEHDGVEITDDGDGWVAEGVPDSWAAADYEGTRFWFVARYNSVIAKAIRDQLDSLSIAYAITGDEKYAHTTALLLDVSATVFPTTRGNVQDGYDGKEDRMREVGRMYRTGYTVERAMQMYALGADLIWNSGELDLDSPTNPGIAIKENIAENIMVDGADYQWRDMHAKGYTDLLHSGTRSYMEGPLLATSLLGLDAGYAEYAIDGPVSIPNMISNNVFRDGTGYSTSGSLYADSYIRTGWLLYYLENDQYPNGYNIFDDPRSISLHVNSQRQTQIAGRDPAFGDSYADVDPITDPGNPGSFWNNLWFYALTSDEKKQGEYAQNMAEIAGKDPHEELAEVDMDSWETEDWTFPLFKLSEISGFDLSDIDTDVLPSDLLGGTGLAMFRPEDGRDRGALLRYGATLNHGHIDELALLVYGAGRELSYDPGRRPVGQYLPNWNRQPVAHLTTVVNETPQVPPGHDGGSLNNFVERTGYTLADVSDEETYEHEDVDTYRRTTAFVDSSDEDSYLVDIFRVAGAETTDYSFHGQGVDFETDGLELSGPEPGSVASPDYWWGDKVNPDGSIEGFEDEARGHEIPPGNGYGFLGNPRRAAGDSQWSASWEVDSSRGSPAKMRLTMLPEENREIIVADAPHPMVEKLGFDPEDHSLQYTLARDEKPASQYVSVIDPVAEEFQVTDVEQLDITRNRGRTGNFNPVAFKTSLKDSGTEDYFVSTVHDENSTVKANKTEQLTTDAEFAMVRTDADGIRAIRMEQGTHLHTTIGGEPFVVDADSDVYAGQIVAVDYNAPSLLVNTDLPKGDQLAGRHVVVDDEEYGHGSPYEISRIEVEGDQSRVYLEPTNMTLSQGFLEDDPTGNVLPNETPLPIARTYNYLVDGNRSINEYFDGKLIENTDTGATTTITDLVSRESRPTVPGPIEVNDSSGFREGDNFVIRDVKVDDGFTIPLSVQLTRMADGTYEVDAPAEVTVRTP